MATIDSRRDQMFPKLTPAEIDRIRRFGTIQRYAKGALLFKTGEVSPGMFVLISGTVAVCWRDGMGHVQPIVEHGPGEFLAEISQLSGRPSLVDASAKADVEAVAAAPSALPAGYEDMTIADIKSASGDWDAAAVAAALAYEQEHGKRKGALAALEAAQVALGGES